MNDNDITKINDIIAQAIDNDALKKMIFSQSTDPKIKKAAATLVTKGDSVCVKVESFTSDNKALTEVLDKDKAKFVLSSLCQSFFKQTNVNTVSHEHQIKISKKGKVLISSRKLQEPIKETNISSLSAKKNYIIDASIYPDFFFGLGICDQNGRVFDKKQSKYKQINRFVEILDDSYDKLPRDGELTVCDLCCGKSYLTFAIYFYLTVIKQRKVTMYGVDLKADCIEFCEKLAQKLDFSGLRFICMDINEFKVENERPIDLVVSLHACDVATDIVLAYAVKNRAKMILSTPCCHHEAFSQLKSENLSFIERHSILKQKFCDAATDSLRALRLESEGYSVTAMELIDPEDTPKNVLIKAFYNPRLPIMKKKLAYEQYQSAVKMLGLEPTLDKLLKQ